MSPSLSDSIEDTDVISRLLPLELLGRIFDYCPRNNSGTPSAKFAPLLLSHACSTWRAASFSLPQLWDTLSLQFLCHDAELIHVRSIANLTKMWFSHIGNSALSLRLHWHGGRGINILEDLVITHSNRLRKLDLFLPSDTEFARFFALPVSRIEHLEHLSMSLAYTYKSDVVDMSIFQFAPRLRKVLLRGLNARWIDVPTSSQVWLPWTQLTHLDIRTCLPRTTWQTLLHQCVHLERCSMFIDFQVQVSNPAAVPHEQTTAVPNLIDLTVSVGGIDSLNHDGWFHNLRFPALKELEIQHADLSPLMANKLHATIPLSLLQRLAIINNAPNYNDMATLLQTAIAVEDLSLWIPEFEFGPCPIIRSILESLVCPSDEASPCLMPRLRVLELWLEHDDDTKETLRHLLKS